VQYKRWYTIVSEVGSRLSALDRWRTGERLGPEAGVLCCARHEMAT
jgi:hypothetical protein